MSMPAFLQDRADAAAPHAQMISSDEVFSVIGVGMSFASGEEIYAQDDETDMVYQVQRGAVRASPGRGNRTTNQTRGTTTATTTAASIMLASRQP